MKYNPIKYSYEVECEEGHGAVGQTVKIVNDKTFLTLCEVKVMYFLAIFRFYYCLILIIVILLNKVKGLDINTLDS